MISPHGDQAWITLPNTSKRCHRDHVPEILNEALFEFGFHLVNPSRIRNILQTERSGANCQRTKVTIDELYIVCTRLLRSCDLKLDFTRLVEVWSLMYDNELRKLDTNTLYLSGSGTSFKKHEKSDLSKCRMGKQMSIWLNVLIWPCD